MIALTPANVAVVGLTSGPAWTYHGRPIPFTRQFDNPTPTDTPNAVIPVERIAGPVLLSCGGDDQTWTSCSYARAADARLAAHHDRYPHRLLAYPHAGHYSNGLLPYEPDYWDPQAQVDEAARISEWPTVLKFLAAMQRA